MTIDYQVLGPLRVVADGHPIQLRGSRLRRLLAVLLVDRGREVATARLVEAVFAGEPPPRAEATLRTYVTRLRRVLGPGTTQTLSHGPAGYRIDVPDESVDAVRFERLASRGRRELQYGDVVGAVGTLRRALEGWYGSAYEEFAHEPWAADEARRLDEARLAAQEHLVDAEMACGRSSDMVPVLRGLVGQDPYREALVSRLVLALYRSGRPADALDAYRAHRDVLADELGIEPSDDLTRLQQRVLARDPELMESDPSGASLRGYRLGERLGTGRRGTVFAARLPGVARDYAVRVYRPELADHPAVVRAFESDAAAAAAVESPFVVTIHDAWREPGMAALVMRRMTGGTLRDRLERGPLDPAEAVRVAERVGGALLAYDTRGRVHGDVGPDSVLYDGGGRAFLGDPVLGVPPGTGADDAADYVALVQACVGATEVPTGSGGLPVVALPSTAGRTLSTTVRDVLARLHRAPPEPANPYVGLRAFDEPDAETFFGRDPLVEQMSRQLCRGSSRLLLVVGGSGSGKSSAVRAGLLPRLRRGTGEPWLVTVMTPGPDPWGNLEQAMRRVATTDLRQAVDGLAEESRALSEAAAAISRPGTRMLLVVDQLDELFSLADDGTQTGFLDALAHAVTAERGRLHVVATLRADYFDRPLGHPRFGALLRDAALPVPPMTAGELEQAVAGPAAGTLTIDPGLTAELVAATADRPAALPALQFTLHELAERGRSRLRLADLRDMGGVAGAIGSRAEALYSAHDEPQRELVRRVLERLVVVEASGSLARRRATRAELVRLAPGPPAVLDDLVEQWIAARLLTADHRPDSREPTVELAHEAVLVHWPRLRHWIERDRSRRLALTELERAAAAWRTLDQDPGSLLRGARLEQALETTRRGSADVPRDVADLVSASVVLREEEARTAADAAERELSATRGLLVQRWLLAAALAVAVVVGAVAVERGMSASRNAAAAQARAEAATVGLLAASNDVLDSDWPLAMLLATEALRIDDSALTRRGLLTALTSPRPLGTVLHENPSGYQAVAVDADSGHLAAKGPRGEVEVVDLDTGEVRQGPLPAPAFPFTGGVAAGGGLVAAGGSSTDGTGAVVYRSGSDLPEVEIPTPVGEESQVAFSPDAGRLAVTSHGTVRVFDTSEWSVVQQLSTGNEDPLISVAWRPDGGRLYAGAGAGRVYAWDVQDRPRPGGRAEPDLPVGRAELPDSDEPAVVDLQPLVGPVTGVAAATFDGAGYLLADDPLRVAEGPLLHDNVTLGAAVGPAGGRLAVAASDEVVVWSVGAGPIGRPERELTVVADAIDVAFHPGGDLITVGQGGDVTRWELEPASPVITELPDVGAGQPYHGPDGRTLAMAGSGAGVRLFDARGTTATATLAIPDPARTSLAGPVFLPGGRLAVLGCPDTRPDARAYCRADLSLFDARTGRRLVGPVMTPEIASWPRALLAASADGHLLATGHVGGRVVLHDAATLEQVAQLDIAGSPVGAHVVQVDFAPDEPLLVASNGLMTAVWDVSGSTPAPVTTRPTGISAAYAPDGRLVTSAQNGTLELRHPRALDVEARVDGLPVSLVDPSFSADGTLMATSDDATGAVRLWTLPDLQAFGGPLEAAGAAMHPDGDAVVLGGPVARRLTLDVDDWTAAACQAAGRNLTRDEWARYFGDEPHRQTCPDG